ncbi:hypothetical protein AB3R30_15435 [Leptolyngbyaceae cyanobacterium UHCC 1019]
MTPSTSLPSAVTALMTLYGTPGQAGFGSAVFYDVIKPGADLEPIAVRYYQHFVGDLWERFGKSAWMRTGRNYFVITQGRHSRNGRQV